ncbi:MAG: hypothetical protein AAGF95_26025 [Chloroflexota bacterium]
MTHLVTGARIALGIIFLVFGLNGFVTFIPVPEFHPFMEILVSSGYMYVVKAIEVIGGIMLLTNRYVPLGLVLLVPVIVNIALFSLFLDPSGWPMMIILVILSSFLLWTYRTYFTGILTPKAEPTVYHTKNVTQSDVSV